MENTPIDAIGTIASTRNGDFGEAVAKPVDAMVSIASKLKENTPIDAIGTIASTRNGNGDFEIEIMNTGRIVHNMAEFVDEAGELV